MAELNELAALIADSTVIDLGHDLFAGMPVHESHPPYIFTPYERHGDFELPGDYWGSNELVVMTGHTGTHIDALSHIAFQGKFFDGTSAKEKTAGTKGMSHLAAESIPPIVGRGIYLDVATAMGVDVLASDYAITADTLTAMLDSAGVTPSPHDTFIIRTGFGSFWNTPTEYLASTRGNPGIDLSAAEYLEQYAPSAIGADTTVVEHCPADAPTLPVHRFLIAQKGVHLIENLNLELMPRRSVVEFLFVCSPLKVRGSTGGPVRPLAIVVNHRGP